MAYGQILRNLTTVGGVVNAVHGINDATHCCFVIQDITTAGAARTLPAIFVDEALGKAANTDVISNVTVAGEVTVDVLVAAAHSLFDIGPIVANNTRLPTQVSPFVSATHLPMRSLHRNVTFTIVNGLATSAQVIVTHLMPTANTVVVVSASSDPSVTTAGGPIPMVVQCIGAAANTVTLAAQTQDGAVSTAGVDTVVTFDVMVLARWGSGLHSAVARPHLTAAGAVGDDYFAGDRAVVGALPSYGAVYTNVDSLAVAPGVAYTHNIGATAGLIAFVTGTVAVGAVKNTHYILNNATSTTTCTLARLNELAGATLNAQVIILRPYSPYIL